MTALTDRIINAATELSKADIEGAARGYDAEVLEEAQKAIYARHGLTEDEQAEAQDLADEWTDEYWRDRPERIAALEDEQTYPVDPHGPWGAP